MQEMKDSKELLLSRAKESLSKTSSPLTAKSLWNAVAASFSPEWAEAHQELNIVKEMMKPENKPLGGIGAGLEGGILRDAHNQALLRYVPINEEVLQNPAVREVFDMLAAHYNVIETSLQLSHGVRDASKNGVRDASKQGTWQMAPALLS